MVGAGTVVEMLELVFPEFIPQELNKIRQSMRVLKSNVGKCGVGSLLF